MNKTNKVYWVALKSDKYNFHSPVYQTRGQAVERLNSYGRPDKAVLRIYSTETFADWEIDQIQVSYPLE